MSWDGASTGSAAGGSGTWDAGTTADWYNGAADVVWPNGSNAIFGGTAGTVTIATGGVTTNSLTFNTAGYTVAGGPLTLTGTSAITANQGATISSAITAAAGLTTAGAGTLVLSGSNTVTGAVNVNAGTLQIGDGTSSNAGTLGAGVISLNIAAGATYALNYLTANNLGNGIPAGVTPTGAGNVAFLGNSTGFYSLGGAGSGSLGITGATILNMNPTSASSGFNATLFAQTANVLAPTSVLTIVSGVLDMRANQTTLGLTSTLPAGTTLATGTTNNGGAVTTDGARNTILTLTPAAGTTYTYAGTVGLPATNAAFTGGTANNYNNAAVGITLNGPGTQILAGTNNYSTATTVTQGTLQFGNGTAGTINGLTSAITVAGGANVIFNDNAQEALASTVAGAGNVTFQGYGTGFLNVNGALTNTGTTTVALTEGATGKQNFQGALFIDGNNTLSAGSVLNVISGNVDLREGVGGSTVQSEVILGLTGTGGYITTDGTRSPTLTITPGSGSTYTYGGVVGSPANGFSAASVSLVLNGAGTQVLTGTNNYTGTTTLSSGALAVTGTIASSAVTITGGTFSGSNAGVLAASVTATGGMLTAATLTGPGQLEVAGTVSISNASIGVLLNGPTLATGYSALIVDGDLILSGANLQLTLGYRPAVGTVFDIAQVFGNDATRFSLVNGTATTLNQGSQFTVNGVTFTIGYTGAYDGTTATFQGGGTDVVLQVAAVPEPSALAFVLAAGAGVLLVAHRRQRWALQ